MKGIIHYVKPHILHSWSHARSFSLIRKRMGTPWQTWMLFWHIRKVFMINTPGWLPVVLAYRYFVSMFVSPVVKAGMQDAKATTMALWKKEK
ncbi:hypothetical protein [Dubosiella muris]|uniref:Uncharacterized protein n=1 Tax=Dubosiella muris TaxID=3038133 RepID=A0AC61R4Z6_9FIRM|nr:hypothetical protein [Dubosiella muris]TGY65057.1 hypothetical protein E5336_10580 [Dubosiella muris]